MTEPEKTLIAGCLRGEKASWDSFVQQYSSLVYHTVRKTLTLHHTDQREDVVDDLYQELFVSLLRDDCKKLRQFRGDRGCTMASWLRVVASRLTIDHLRQQRPKDVEATDAIPSDQLDASSADSLEAHAMDCSLREAQLSGEACVDDNRNFALL
jgi:RNA polymerase sigma factor (sigma-70 family)